MASPIPFIPNIAAEKDAISKARVDSFGPTTIARCALGLNHSMIICRKGDLPQLYVWGKNHNNIIGLGADVKERTYPGLVQHFAKHHVFAVSTGTNHSMVVVKKSSESGGKLYSFGLGNRGRLGYTKTEAQETENEDAWFTPKPVRVKFPERIKIVRVSCGSDHTLALTENGSLFTWGIGAYGNLGTGDTADRYSPTLIKISKGKSVVHFSAGAKHSMACTDDGLLWCWGHGGDGRLGLGHSRGAVVPTVIDHLRGQDVVFVCAGESHSACIDRKSVLYTWGSGSYGRLGHGDEATIGVPRKVEELGGIPVMQVACGTFHNLAVTKKGVVYSWGAGAGLGIGDDGDQSIVSVPHIVKSLTQSVLSVAVGPYHSMVITVSGDTLCWGVGGQSRLGHGDQINQPRPKHVADLRSRIYVDDINALLGVIQYQAAGEMHEGAKKGGKGVVDSWKVQTVGCGKMHSILLTSGGAIWVWGSNEYGQLGLGEQEEDDQHEPVHLEKFSEPVKQVACGGSHCLALDFYGNVHAWGSGDSGQLGLGVARTTFTPTGVPIVSNAVNIYAGEDYSACITCGVNSEHSGYNDYGDLWTWGSAEAGKLGHGSEITAGALLTPKMVPTKTPIWMCALGQSHMIAISANGDLYSWGAGYYGRLGIGSNANAYVPTRVNLPDGVTAYYVAAGSHHSCAISQDLDLWVWGRKKPLCSPEDIMEPRMFLQLEGPDGVPKVKYVACGPEHTFAVTTTSQLWAWGDNKRFQLGCGKQAAERFDRPEMISTLPDGTDKVMTGQDHSFAVLCNGDTFAWGASAGGQLGIGFKKKKYIHTPEKVMAHWASLGALDFGTLGGEETDRGEEQIKLEQSLDEAYIDQFLDTLILQGYQEQGSSFAVIQNLLKAEEKANRPEAVSGFEDDLILVLGRHLDFILKLKEGENELEMQEQQFEQVISETTLPFLQYSRPRLSRNVAPSIIQEKHAQIEELVWMLQQQPSYLLHLASHLNGEWEKLAYLNFCKYLFKDIENRRVDHLFGCLLRVMLSDEVQRATGLLSLFHPDTSIVFHLVRMYFLSERNLSTFAPYLLDVKEESSIAAIVAGLGSGVHMSLDPESYAMYTGIGDKERLRLGFHQGLEGIRTVLVSGLPGLMTYVPLPGVLRLCLLYARHAIVERQFPIDYNYMSYGLDFCYNIPICKLLLNAMLEPIFQDPAKFQSRCGIAVFADTRLNACYSNISLLLHSSVDEDYMGLQSIHMLKGIITECQSALVPAVAAQINVEDTLDIDLTLDLFISHLDTERKPVVLRSSDIAVLVNMLKLYEAHLNLSSFDPVAKLVKEIGDGRSPPFDDATLTACESSMSWMCFHINQRFLLKEKNLVYCPITHAPVPQRLAPRQQAFSRMGQTIMSLVIRYVPPDEYDPRWILQECLRVLPPVKAKDWPRLKEELEVLAEYYVSQTPPDYEFGSRITTAAKKVDEMFHGCVNIRDVQRWMALEIKHRSKHKKYLKHIQDSEDIIDDYERAYMYAFSKRRNDLKAAIEFAKTLQLEPFLVAQSKATSTPLKLEEIRRARAIK